MAAFGEVQAEACSSKADRYGPRPLFAPAGDWLYAAERLDAAKKKVCDVETDNRNTPCGAGDDASGRFLRFRFFRSARVFSAPPANRQDRDLSARSAGALHPARHSAVALRLLQPAGHRAGHSPPARLERGRELPAGARLPRYS